MAEGFLERLPNQLSGKDAHPETYKATPEGGIVSLGVFHKQECDRFNVLISTIQRTLKMLSKALKGIVVMSSQLEEMFHAFLLQQNPAVWEDVAYPCLKPLNSWVHDFELRVDFMGKWLQKGPPSSFWVPCFYFPQGFMTASMQVYARSTKIPIDTLTFWTEPTTILDTENAPLQEKGVNVHGFFIQGAGWAVNEMQIAESEPAELFKLLPVIWLNPLLQAEFSQNEKMPGRYKCPVYKTSERKGTLSTTGHSTNFVTYFYQPSSEDQAHWVRRGVALLCMLDE
jgi:dynein heavy chain